MPSFARTSIVTLMTAVFIHIINPHKGPSHDWATSAAGVLMVLEQIVLVLLSLMSAFFVLAYYLGDRAIKERGSNLPEENPVDM